MITDSQQAPPLADVLLARIGGEIAAVFTPARNPRDNRGAIVEARAVYAAGGGVPWRHGATGEMARKAIGAALDELARAGLVTRKVDRLKTASVDLTDDGHERAAALAGAGGRLAGWLSAHEIRRLSTSQHARAYGGGVWIPEWLLAGTGANWSDATQADVRNELETVEGMALPGIRLGWIEANADSAGRAWYRTLADDFGPEPGALEESLYRVKYTEAWRDGARAAWSRLTTKPTVREIGTPPMPCSMG